MLAVSPTTAIITSPSKQACSISSSLIAPSGPPQGKYFTSAPLFCNPSRTDTQSACSNAIAHAPQTSAFSAAKVPTRLIFSFLFNGRTFFSFFNNTIDFFAASSVNATCSSGNAFSYCSITSSGTYGFSNNPSHTFTDKILRTASSTVSIDTLPSLISCSRLFE